MIGENDRMDFADIITILLDSNFEGTIIRVFAKNGNEYQGRANIVKIKPHTRKDYCELKIETGAEVYQRDGILPAEESFLQ